MSLERPDLSEVSPAILTYIESLEADLARASSKHTRRKAAPEPEPEPAEAPTTINVITLSAAGIVKRTPRHHYTRQRRGGMGVFDLDTPATAPPTILALADETDTLLIFSDQGRSYRLSVSRITETPVHARGSAIAALIPLREGEHVVAILPATGGDQVALIGARGWTNVAPASFVSKSMIPGVAYYDAKKHGPLAAACWLNDDDDLFIAAKSGIAIRFPGKRVPKSGGLGLRLDKDDAVISATATREQGNVFLISAAGKGTLRQMTGFRANKSPGGGGKVALKTDHLVAACAAHTEDDIFIITRNAKLIRFRAAGIPPKTGTVQGVNCMALRGDETTAATVSLKSKVCCQTHLDFRL